MWYVNSGAGLATTPNILLYPNHLHIFRPYQCTFDSIRDGKMTKREMLKKVRKYFEDDTQSTCAFSDHDKTSVVSKQSAYGCKSGYAHKAPSIRGQTTHTESRNLGNKNLKGCLWKQNNEHTHKKKKTKQKTNKQRKLEIP